MNRRKFLLGAANAALVEANKAYAEWVANGKPPPCFGIMDNFGLTIDLES